MWLFLRPQPGLEGGVGVRHALFGGDMRTSQEAVDLKPSLDKLLTTEGGYQRTVVRWYGAGGGEGGKRTWPF